MTVNLDAHVKSQKAPVIVIPANAGIQENQPFMDSRIRGSDSFGDFLRGHQSSIVNIQYSIAVGDQGHLFDVIEDSSLSFQYIRTWVCWRPAVWTREDGR